VAPPPPTDTVAPETGAGGLASNGAIAPVIPLGARRQRPAPVGAGWAAVLVAVALACSPLASGYYDFSVWGPLALGAMVLVVIVAWSARPALTRYGVAACVGLGLLLALSAASMLWADSKESAWTAVNRLGLYCIVFAIVLLAVRGRRTARAVIVIIGCAALITSVWLCASFLFGSGQGAFLGRRLNSPIGYINGTAGLLVMGVWPWLALSETASRRLVRAGSLAAAAVIASTFVLTESRAVIPATVLSAVIVIVCAPERTRRAINLLILAAAVAATLPWTLPVYSSGGLAARGLAPSHGLLRAAGVAIVLAALGAGAVRLLLAALASRIGPDPLSLAIRRLGAVLLAVTIAGVAAGAVIGAPWFAREYRSFTALHVNQSASVRFIDASGYRYDLWRVAVREFRSHPLGGVGAGNYDAEYYRLRNNPQYVLQPHSIELQMAAELGIGGILALLLFCGAILRAGFARSGTLASQDRMLKVAALGMFAAWLVDTSVDWLYDIPGLAGMAFVAAALLVIPATRARETGRPRAAARTRVPGRRAAALVVGLTVLALLAASVGRQYVATRYAESGSSQVTRSPREAIGTLRSAARLDPYSLTTLYSLASAYARLDDYSGARTTLAIAARREPDNYVPPALLGDLAMRRGDYRVAVADYRLALTLNPRDPELRQSQLAARAAAR
jgi:O-Antigen ligase